MNIDKNFVDETNKLITHKELLEVEIEEKFGVLKERLEEIREKYGRTLKELEKEYGTSFYGYSDMGWREIQSIADFGNYYEIEAIDCFRDQGGEMEVTKVPYDDANDDAFVREYKELRRKEFFKEKEMKLAEERNKYLELKKKFENTK